jgi:predicted RNase H-like nuclease
LGVDGTSKGWVVAVLPDRQLLHVSTLTELPADAAICIDIPLGFPQPGERRPAEVAALEILGSRRASLFPTPARSVYDATDYAQACEIARQLSGKAISRQTWALRAKVLEAQRVLPQRAALEVHPETVFATLAGQPARFSKATWDGYGERSRLLTDVQCAPESFEGAAGAAKPDDVLDAIAAAWVAQRWLSGGATALGNENPEGLGQDCPIWT